MLTEYFAVEAGPMELLPAKACESQTYFRSSFRNDDRKYVCASQANGTEEAKKKKRKPGMQSTGGWDIPESPSPPKESRNRANGTEEVKKKRRKPGMQSTGGWDIPDAPPPKKKVLYVFQRFFCPVGDERSLSVILFSDW